MIELGVTLTPEDRVQLEPLLRAIPTSASAFERLHFAVVACLQNGLRDLAAQLVPRAIALEPDQDSPWKNLSYLSFYAGDNLASLRSIRKACRLDPLAPDARARAGLCLLRLGDYAAGAHEFRAGLCLDPSLCGGNLNLGVALNDQLLSREAMISFFREINVYPAAPEAYFNLGNAALGLGCVVDATQYYVTAIQMGLRTAEIFTSSALAHLSCGNFEIGWEHFEQRFLLPEHSYAAKQLAVSKPLVRSESSVSGRVLVWAEQGLGDEIMFGSLINEFASRCDSLLVQLDSRLLPLFRRSFGLNVDFIERGFTPAESLYDMHIPIGGLGRILRPTRESFSSQRGVFLLPDNERAQRMRARLCGESRKFVIGVSWKTTNVDTRIARDIPLSELVAALSRHDVLLVNLQYGEFAEDLQNLQDSGVGEVHHYPGLDTHHDIDGVAALVQACDLVISIGNTVAHIAGAIGKRTFLLLPSPGVRASANRVMPGWRWLADGDTSIWYRTIKIFRCHQGEGWAEVLINLSSACDQLLSGSSHRSSKQKIFITD